MRLLFASSEIYPLVKTGGLADVAGALPAALARSGLDVRLVMPAYRGTAEKAKASPKGSLGDPFGYGDVRILEGRMPDSGLPVWLVDNGALFDRDGGPYLNPEGGDWRDNDMRFATLSWAAAKLCQPDNPLGWVPDILHCHDWQTGLAPAYLRAWGEQGPGTVFTIHNMAYQGIFPAELVPKLGLPWDFFTMDGFEFWNQISYLKAGLAFSDRLTTVSPTYAREIQTGAFGFGLNGLLSHRSTDLSGILNGADYGIWDPVHDRHLARAYDRTSVTEGKAANKAALQRELGLPENPAAPLLIVISRLSEQKGSDLLLSAMPAVIAQGAQFALLGAGERGLEDAFRALAEARPDNIAIRIGYSEELAHRMQAGGDILLMPSRFEPCGLTQIYAMRYGTLPLVQRTGGLADTVVDATYDQLLHGKACGFVFGPPTAAALQWSMERAVALMRQTSQWRRIQDRAMTRIFDWHQSASLYYDLYRGLRPESGAAPRFDAA